ncbi:hypothetical protein D3C84_726270 [compost metagenome]
MIIGVLPIFPAAIEYGLTVEVGRYRAGYDRAAMGGRRGRERRPLPTAAAKAEARDVWNQHQPSSCDLEGHCSGLHRAAGYVEPTDAYFLVA